jgi:hypothetical protein
MTTDDSDDSQLEELNNRIESLEGAGETLEETADSLFDGVDDATDQVTTNEMAKGTPGPVDLLPSRKRLLGFAGGAFPVFLGVTLLGIPVVPVLVSQLLFCVTVLEIAATAVVPCREYLPDDPLGGAVLGLVVSSVAFLFTHLAELAAGAI